MTLAAGQRVHECRTARVYAAAFAVMGAISGTVALVDLQQGRVSSVDAGWAAVLGVAALLAVVLFVRALSFGIYVQPELVVVRSWFRTRHVSRAVIRRVRRAEYEGLLRLGPSFVVTEMLVIDTHDDGRIALPVSLCTERRARRALASIAAHGLEVAPKASSKAAPSLSQPPTRAVRIGVTTRTADVGGGVPRGTLLLIFPADEHGRLVAYLEPGVPDVYDDYWSEESLGDLLESAGFLELEGAVASVLRRDVFRVRARAE